MDTFTLFFWLLVGHAVADYPLQHDFLAKAKCPNRVPGVPWVIAMTAHCLIHAGAVALVTRNPVFAVCEFIVHFMLDWLKCQGMTGFAEDQFLHVCCKVSYLIVDRKSVV